ncbi:MAG: CCA tRNA nucleotidyltransferase [Rickettsiales endosymbiont of Dermacentor nuttalli]
MSLTTLDNNKEALHLLQILQSTGKEARFVGGCVRDAYLDKQSSDIDIATNLLPEETIAIMHQNQIKAVTTGFIFGTVTVIFDKQTFEITTLRQDIYCNGRHAKVLFTDSWQEDAARRDFTINTISYSPIGQIYDYFNGIDDLKQGIIRFVGNPHDRIVEDYLRILRLFRFFAYYGKTKLESNTLIACQDLAKGINILSGERIQTEMYKILISNSVADVLLLMYNINVLPYLINCTNIDFEYLKSLLIVESKFSIPPTPIRRLSALLYNKDKQTITQLITRWKLSSKDKSHLYYLATQQLLITGNETEKDLYKILRSTNKYYVYDSFILLWTKILQKNSAIDETKLHSILNIINNWLSPSPPINGDDLIKLGISPSKQLGILLKEAINFWEENNYNPSKDEIIQMIQSKM